MYKYLYRQLFAVMYVSLLYYTCAASVYAKWRVLHAHVYYIHVQRINSPRSLCLSSSVVPVSFTSFFMRLQCAWGCLSTRWPVCVFTCHREVWRFPLDTWRIVCWLRWPTTPVCTQQLVAVFFVLHTCNCVQYWQVTAQVMLISVITCKSRLCIKSFFYLFLLHQIEIIIS